MKVQILVLATLVLSAASALAADKDSKKATSLFNGKNLDGWTQRNGTATYRVEEDAIVGKTNDGSPNSFLCTDKLYGDFVLEF